MAAWDADVEAPDLLGKHVTDAIEGGVVTAVVMCVEYVDPESGDRQLFSCDSLEGTVWSKVGMAHHLIAWLSDRYDSEDDDG